MSDFQFILIILLCLLFQAFFSGSEIAIIASSRFYIHRLVNRGSRRARLLLRFKEKPESFLPITLIGTNLSAITGSTIATSFLISRIGPGSELYVTLFLAPLFLLLGEMVPKSVFRVNADTYSLKITYPLKMFYYIFFPVAFIIRKFAEKLMDLFNIVDAFPSVTRDEIMSMFRNKTGKDEETRMIERVMSFNETLVKEVMVPLIDVVAIEENSKIGDVMDILTKHPFSVFPVYRERVDKIAGIIRVFDLLRAEDFNQPIKNYLLEPIFVQESQRAFELLQQLKELHMAIVVDEYGGTTGIVTVEDIMEEVVGEIEGEHRINLPHFRTIGKRTFIVKGRSEIDSLNEMLNLGLPDGDYETIAGFIITKIGRLPEADDVFNYGNMTFTIRRASEKTIEEVLIQINQE
ncbi:MAG TPA: hemolysin family protein [bacterium]